MKVKKIIYLEWLCDAHNGAHIVAVVTQYEVARILWQFFLGKSHLEIANQNLLIKIHKLQCVTSECFFMQLNACMICPYLVLLSQEIRLFLLGPSVSHIVFMVLKPNL